jgi:hypothetical protein
MKEIKFYKSPLRAVRLIALSIPFIALGIWVLLRQDNSSIDIIMGILCTCFFGLGLIIGITNLFDHRPQIIIDEKGIWDRTTKQDVIDWDGIKDAYPLSINGQKFVPLVLDESVKTKNVQYKWAFKLTSKVGGQKVNLYLGQIRIDQNTMVEFIQSMAKANITNRRQLISLFAEKLGQ